MQDRPSENDVSALAVGWEAHGAGGGRQRVRRLAGLVSRFGIGRRFYAALSVRHVYANLQHLAAERGFPRRPAQTPNDYLPTLEEAFPGHEDAIRHITTLYNAYEYGDIPTGAAEIGRLHAAWDAIRRETGTGQVARQRRPE